MKKGKRKIVESSNSESEVEMSTERDSDTDCSNQFTAPINSLPEPNMRSNEDKVNNIDKERENIELKFALLYSCKFFNSRK